MQKNETHFKDKLYLIEGGVCMINKMRIALLLICVLCLFMFSACTDNAENTGSKKGETAGTVEKTSDATVEKVINVYEENGLPKDEEVTLKIAIFEGGSGREWYNDAMNSFVKKFPNVKLEPIFSPKIGTIIQTKVAANDDVDMFNLFSSVLSEIELVSNKKIISQEHLWDHKLYDTPDKTLKDIAVEGIYETNQRNEGLSYCLPMYTQASGLFFDQNLFDEKGWNKFPKTWDEFLSLCEEIKKSGIDPLIFPGIYPDYLDRAFGAKNFEIAEINGNLDQYTDNFRNYEGPQYTSLENIVRWGKIAELGKKGYFAEGIAALNHTQSQMQVLQHKTAMVSTGSFVQNEMKDSTPEGFKWGFMAVPFSNNPDDTTWIFSSTSRAFHVWDAKPDLEKRWSEEFIVWLWNMDVQVTIAEKAGMLPIRKDFSDDPERVAKLKEAPKSVLQYMENKKTKFENLYRQVSINDPLVAQAKKLYDEAVVSMCLGDKDFEPVLQEAEKILQEAIKANKSK